MTWAFAVSIALAVTPASHAQSNSTGSISGEVTGGSKVSVEEMASGFKRTVTASPDGSYRIGALPPGTYRVSYTDSAGVAQTTSTDVAIGLNSNVGSKTGVLELDRMVVGSNSINPIDFTNTEAVTTFSSKQIDLLPVARNTTAIALLAPGTTLGDSAFNDEGPIASFGGSSVAENAYFVNGFNLSNFRNGLNPASVPFEFYENFEIKTGGYSAEFGRSTGGVIIATTKRGTNEYHAGASVIWTPNKLKADAPSSYFKNLTGDVVPRIYNGADYLEEREANVWVSGPLLKNKVFFYGLYELRDSEKDDATVNGTQLLSRRSKDPFWGVKVDVVPFQDHHFEYTGFTDKNRRSDVLIPFDWKTGVSNPTQPAINYLDRGGYTHIGSYTGVFFEKLQLHAMYGQSTQNRTDSGTQDTLPFIYDGRSGSLVYVQGNPNLLTSKAKDKRKVTRFDAEYSFNLLGTHRLRAGFDRENNLSVDESVYSGGLYYRYYAIPASGKINGVAVPPGTTAAVRSRIYQNGGSFAVKSDAWYVEDNWSLWKDRMVMRLGLRNESFKNLNTAGDAFIEIKNQYAPRLGATFDLFGDKKTKIFANFGRYHLPVASNTNVRLAGAELFTEVYNVLTSVSSDLKTPVIGAQIGPKNVFSDGTIKDRRQIVDLDIKPMYQDEWILGAQHQFTKKVSAGFRFIARELDSTAMDDVIVDHALNAWAAAHGFTGFDATGEHAYVLSNPGRPIHMFWDFNGNGTLDSNEEATLTPEMLQYPKAQRKYYSMELFAEKIWDNKWSAQFSYTWAHSYGNYEGWVLSDTGQDDAGITTLFDSPLITTNTFGNLPNDRRHQFKAFGSYALTPEFRLGLNLLLSSGRAINKLGSIDDPVRGSTSNDYLLVPRGSAGTTPWLFQTDVSLSYKPKWAKGVSAYLTVYNILNRSSYVQTTETSTTAAGGVEPSYLAPWAWQQPRSVRVSLRYEF